MEEAIAEHNGAIPAFLVITVDRETFDCYVGYVEKLRSLHLNCKGIPMSPKAPQTYEYQTVAVREKHNLDYESITNLTEHKGIHPGVPPRHTLNVSGQQ